MLNAVPARRSETKAPKVVAAVGDSLTAGMQDFTLTDEFQRSSFPNLLAQQMKAQITQPHVDGRGIPPVLFQEPKSKSRKLLSSLLQVSLASALPMAFTALHRVPPKWMMRFLHRIPAMGRAKSLANHGNSAIPGVEMRHLADVKNVRDFTQEMATGLEVAGKMTFLAPFAHHFLQNGQESSSGRSQLEQAVATEPDLVTLWAGTNDALPAAFGVVNDTTLTPIEDTGVHKGFKTSVTQSVDKLLTETDAKIVLLNVPDVTEFPMFKTMGKPIGELPFQISLTNGTDVTDLVESFVVPSGKKGGGEYDGGSKVRLFHILAKLGGLRNRSRADFAKRLEGLQEKEGLFKADDVLDPGEKMAVKQRIADYNDVLAQVAKNERVQLLDIAGTFSVAQSEGIPLKGEGPERRASLGFDGQRDSSGQQGIFSFDGLHLTELGNAMIANSILELDADTEPSFIDEKAVAQRSSDKTRSQWFLSQLFKFAM